MHNIKWGKYFVSVINHQQIISILIFTQVSGQLMMVDLFQLVFITVLIHISWQCMDKHY